MIQRPSMYKTQKNHQQRSCDAPPRATRRSGDNQRLSTHRHAPTQTPHALDAPSADMCRHGWRHHPLPGLTRTNLETWPGPNRLPKKKILNKKKGKRKYFDQVDLWPWPKSQNFQNRPVPLNFSSTFRFWDLFLYSKLRNCANVQFPKVDQKVKIFKKDLSCLIFRVDSIFGVYFFIQESGIA